MGHGGNGTQALYSSDASSGDWTLQICRVLTLNRCCRMIASGNTCTFGLLVEAGSWGLRPHMAKTRQQEVLEAQPPASCLVSQHIVGDAFSNDIVISLSKLRFD